MPVFKFTDGYETSGGCYGFFGRDDDYDPFESDLADHMKEHNCYEGYVHPRRGDGSFFDKEAEGYLTWLFGESPYRSVFLSTPQEAIQQGEAKITLDVCNQSLILGLSHLRRSEPLLHSIWNELPDNMNGGLKAVLCMMMHPWAGGLDHQLGAGQGEDTSTVFKYFDGAALQAWMKGKELNEETFANQGNYTLDFCTIYGNTYSSSGATLEYVLEDTLRGQIKTERLEGMFYKGEVSVRNKDVRSFADEVIRNLLSTESFKCIEPLICKTEGETNE